MYRAIAPVENKGCLFTASSKDALYDLINKSEFGGEFIIQKHLDYQGTWVTVGKQVFVGGCNSLSETVDEAENEGNTTNPVELEFYLVTNNSNINFQADCTACANTRKTPLN